MKLEKIRLASDEEIEQIKSESNLNLTSRVLKMGEITGVWKVVHELDPVFLNGASTAKFYKFVWGVENIMRGSGASEYYFNVPAEGNEEYKKIIQEFGGEQISKQPDLRFKVVL